MFATQDLAMVLRRQDELRHQAQHDRIAAKTVGTGSPDRRTRRVLGLRLSLA